MAAEHTPPPQVKAQQQATRVAQRLANVGASQAQRHVTAAEQSGNANCIDRTSSDWQRVVDLARAVAITRAKRRDTITHGEVKWVILDELRRLVDAAAFEDLLVAIGHEDDGAPLGAIIVDPDTGQPSDDYLLAAMERGFDEPPATLQRRVYEHFG